MSKCSSSPRGVDVVDSKEDKEANKMTGEDTENKGRGNRNCKTI